MEYALGKHRGVGKIYVMTSEPNSHVWSFCRDRWVLRSNCQHCEECDICYDDAWHCRACRTCKVGRWLACSGCRGHSFTGFKYGVLEGRFAQDAQTLQGGLSLGRPKKRAREVRYSGYHLPSEVSYSLCPSILDTADTSAVLDSSRHSG